MTVGELLVELGKMPITAEVFLETLSGRRVELGGVESEILESLDQAVIIYGDNFRGEAA